MWTNVIFALTVIQIQKQIIETSKGEYNSLGNYGTIQFYFDR